MSQYCWMHMCLRSFATLRMTAGSCVILSVAKDLLRTSGEALASCLRFPHNDPAIIGKSRMKGELMIDPIEAFLADYTPEVQDISRVLRAMVKSAMPQAHEVLFASQNHISYSF